jgi:hypothetical protein
MSGVDPLGLAKGSISAVGEVIKVAGDNPDVRAGGRELGKAFLTITKTINLALLPLAAVNFGFDKAREYFRKDFQDELAEKLRDVPEESIVAPKPSIAGPALQGLAFSHEEPDLKELYLSLLASAMDGRTSQEAHPAFVEVIRQLTAEEARYLRTVLTAPNTWPIAEFRLNLAEQHGFLTLCRHVMKLDKVGTVTPVENPRLPAFVDNWIRLGLVDVDYGKRLVGHAAYEWVDSRPELSRLKAERESEGNTITFEKGVLDRTAFGLQFAVATGIVGERT